MTHNDNDIHYHATLITVWKSIEVEIIELEKYKESLRPKFCMSGLIIMIGQLGLA